jgi:hypothetical protein
MLDKNSLIAGLDFARARLLGTLDTIEKVSREKGHDVNRVLAWQPGPGRAHMGWQAMHCAATHEKYVTVTLLGKPPKDEAFLAAFAGGSTPSDQNVPTLAAIRDRLGGTFLAFKEQVSAMDGPALARTVPGPNNTQRTVADVILLLAWHEGHHQGQIHLTWNLYKGTHGVL